MVDSKEKQSCCGCTACAQACPKHCITMMPDPQGFLYPKIDHDLCIECGVCDHVCRQAALPPDRTVSSATFGALNPDDAVRAESSSGGVFSVLADAVLRENGVVFGAAMSSDSYSVEHICAETADDLARLRGSKYVQSRLNETFSRVKEALHQGRIVLFSGTPCQVSGLKAFLGKDYENLLCVDFFCHGVPSERVWKQYCEEVERKKRAKIISVSFRQKKNGWEDYGTALRTEKNETVFQEKWEDPFIKLFLRNYPLRPSCFSCTQKGISRKSDITLADFWGVKKVLPQLFDPVGTSLLLVHTEKGKRFLDAVSDHLIMMETDGKMAADCNKSALRSARRPEDLDRFWKDLDSMTVYALSKKYVPVSAEMKIKSALKKTPLYSFIKRANR